MKKIIIAMIFPFIVSCSLSKMSGLSTRCRENKKFKKTFFDKIDYIGANIYGRSPDSTFISTLIFISNYAPVSFYKMRHYVISYTPDVFQNDKKVWLRWYEENKCKNIKLKNSHPIPYQYKSFFDDFLPNFQYSP